jgi:hypothetical protein
MTRRIMIASLLLVALACAAQLGNFAGAISGTPSTVAPTWTLVQNPYTTNGAVCSGTQLTCALNLTQATAAGNVFLWKFRCGSNSGGECHPTLVQTYTGTAGSNVCSGTLKDTLSVDAYGQSTPSTPVNNAAIGHLIGTSSGANCIEVTRDTSSLDVWYQALEEWTYGAGGSPLTDGAAQITLDVIPSGSNPYSYLGQSMSLSGRNDIVGEVCACGANMTSVSPGAWSGVFINQFASVYESNVTSATFATPTMTTTSSGSSIPGVVAAIAITD